MARGPGTHDPNARPADTPFGGAASDTDAGTTAGASDSVLRPMTHADIPAGLGLCRASGWNQVSRDWEHFLAVNPAGARVLEHRDLVVGTVTSLRYGRFGWLAMVLVDPAARGRGLGTRLLLTGLDLLRDLPCTRLDATPAGQGLYRAHGFEEEGRLSRMARAFAADGPCRVSPIVRPITSEDLSRVAKWDCDAFGANRRPMLDWLYAGAPEYAWIAESSGRLAGYVLGRHGFAYHHLGPVIAQDVSIATQLVSTCLANHVGRSFIIDATRLAPEWIHGLETMGFRELRPFMRMRLGGDRFGLPQYQFASAGPELG